MEERARASHPIAALLSDRKPSSNKHLQNARLTSPYPKCAASTPSAATGIPCACSCRSDLLPQPYRIAHSRTLLCSPTTCQTHEPAGLLIPPNAAIA
jgi:hypothetical protein